MCFDAVEGILDEGQVRYDYVSRLSDWMWRIQNSLGFLQAKSFVTEDGLKCIQVSLGTVLSQMAVSLCAKVDITEIS